MTTEREIENLHAAVYELQERQYLMSVDLTQSEAKIHDRLGDLEDQLEAMQAVLVAVLDKVESLRRCLQYD